MKNCKKCNQEKDFDKFSKKSKSKDGLNDTCKICRKELDKIYYSKNKEDINKKSKKWYDKNKEKHTKCVIKYQLNNPEIKKKAVQKWQKNNREYFKKWRKEKYDNDPNFKLRITLSVRLSDILRKNKSYKTSSIIKLIGCTLDELKQYIQNQFKPEFNWNNWGEVWELDHIISCSKFDLINLEQQKQCFHYTNLRPIFKTTKIAESFGYIDEIGNRNKSSN